MSGNRTQRGGIALAEGLCGVGDSITEQRLNRENGAAVIFKLSNPSESKERSVFPRKFSYER
jgi:hypothetical protein